MTVPLARSCCQTLRPLGTGIVIRSPKPRTPLSVPKYWSKERFSCIRITTCCTSMTVPVTLLAGMASARRMLGGKAASAAAEKAAFLPACRRLRREIMVKPCLSPRSGSTAHLRLGRLGGGRGIGGGRRGRRAVIAATTGGQRGCRQADERQRLDQTLVSHGVFHLDVDRFRPARI